MTKTINQPNILFIFPDQWRGDALSCLGSKLAETPFLDALAAQGTLFESAYTNSPVCIPARACLVTGKRPETTGRLGYRDAVAWPYKDTMMTVLRDNGYQTLLSGKTHFYPARIHLGFEQMELYDNQRMEPGFKSDYDLWLEEKTGGLIKDTAQELNSNSQLVQPWTHEEALHVNSWTVTKGIEMVEKRDPTRPFFLNLTFHRPHPPYDPPMANFERMADVEIPEPYVGDWAAEYEKLDPLRIDPITGQMPKRLHERACRAYYAQINHIDYQVGRMLRYLQLHGMLDNTLVLFASDHGEQLGEHNFYRKSTPLEGSLKIPMIVKMPKACQAPEGKVSSAPVALHDIMPTFLEAAGIEIPEEVEGSSMLPVVMSEEDPEWRTHVHCEMSNGFKGSWECVTDGKEKYIWIAQTGEEFFFDLVNDPHELHNLAADEKYQQKIEMWRARLLEEIKDRTEDGLTDGEKLTPGGGFTSIRQWLLDIEV